MVWLSQWLPLDDIAGPVASIRCVYSETGGTNEMSNAFHSYGHNSPCNKKAVGACNPRLIQPQPNVLCWEMDIIWW